MSCFYVSVDSPRPQTVSIPPDSFKQLNSTPVESLSSTWASLSNPDGSRPSEPPPPAQTQNFTFFSLLTPGGGLKAQDDGQTFHPHTKHIVNDENGNSMRNVFGRLEREPNTQFNSTFYNRNIAEHEGSKLISANQSRIESWLASNSQDPCVLSSDADGGVGRAVKRGGKDSFHYKNGAYRYNLEATKPTIKLLRDDSMETGYRVETHYVGGENKDWRPEKK